MCGQQQRGSSIHSSLPWNRVQCSGGAKHPHPSYSRGIGFKLWALLLRLVVVVDAPGAALPASPTLLKRCRKRLARTAQVVAAVVDTLRFVVVFRLPEARVDRPPAAATAN